MDNFNNFFIPMATDSEISKERQAARELRKSRWWKEKVAQGICYYCEEKFSPEEITMDHVVPLIRGGKSTKNNIVAACKTCNSQKKHMLPMEWAEYIEKLKKK